MERGEHHIFSSLSEDTIQKELKKAGRDNKIGLIGVLASAVVAIGAVIYASQAETDLKAEIAVIPAVTGLVGAVAFESRLESSGEIGIALGQELNSRK